MKNLYTKSEARDRMMRGISKAAEAVGATMGTGGSNALIEAIENPGHLATNDGATILSAIRFDDPLEEMGRKILLEAVSRANKASGDGSSTTTVLTEAVLRIGTDFLDKASPMEIKRSLDDCVSFIEDRIRAQSKDITVNDVKDVASISAEDDEIGALIQEIYQQIGKDGIIHWDISKTTDDSYTIGNGITINDAGFISPYLCDIDEKTGQFLNVARWKNAPILITKQKITSASDFNSLFQAMFEKDMKECVVFCNEIEAPVIPDLIKTRAIRGFKTLVVKMPVLWRDQWFEDLALATGATVIDNIAGLPLKSATLEHLGRVDNIIVTKDDTFIDGIKDLSEHIAHLENENTDDSKLRASRLNTKTARLFIGAQSDSALSYKRLKVEDAISAAWQALHGGVVPGGGVAMRNVFTEKDELDTIGKQIMYIALRAPEQQIWENAGVATFDKFPVGNYGVDTRTGEVVDMLEKNIINPTNVEVNAVKNAVSVAATILTTSTVVTLPREDEKYETIR